MKTPHPLRGALLGALLAAPAVAQNQQFLVSGFGSNAVHRYDFATGAVLGSLPVSQPLGAVEGPDGLLYVAAEGVDKVLRFDPSDWSLVDEFIADDPLTPQDETGGLDNPTGITFDPDGNVYVASFETDEVLRYDSSGGFVDVFVTQRSSGLNGPDAGLTFGPDGHLYVPSYFGNRIERYDGETGAPLGDFTRGGNPGNPRGIVFRSDGMALVAHEGTNRISLYDWDGNFVRQLVTNLVDPTGFAISAVDGNVYATSVSANVVRRFNGTTGDGAGRPVRPGDGGLSLAVALTIFPDGHLRTGRLEPGTAGTVNQLRIRAATPDAPVLLLLGSQHASIPVPGCDHRFLGIGDPVFLMTFADSAGEVALSGSVSAVQQGFTLLCQAYDLTTCRVSNLVQQTLD